MHTDSTYWAIAHCGSRHVSKMSVGRNDWSPPAQTKGKIYVSCHASTSIMHIGSVHAVLHHSQ